MIYCIFRRIYLTRIIYQQINQSRTCIEPACTARDPGFLKQTKRKARRLESDRIRHSWCHWDAWSVCPRTMFNSVTVCSPSARAVKIDLDYLSTNQSIKNMHWTCLHRTRLIQAFWSKPKGRKARWLESDRKPTLNPNLWSTTSSMLI